MMGLSPEMLGLLGMQLLQQSQSGNANSLGLLPMALLNSQIGVRQEQDTPALPVTAQLQQVSVPGTDNMQLLKDYTDIMGQTARTPAEQNDVQLNKNFIQKYEPSYVKASAPTNNTQISPYFAQLKSSAEATYPNNPTLQQVAISQALLESGVKPSRLATQNNNYFGIKAPQGAAMMTQEYVNGKPVTERATFAVNPNMQASFNQHRDLMNKARYQPVMTAANPMVAFNALQKAGYATDPSYANKLRSVYNRYVQPLYMS